MALPGFLTTDGGLSPTRFRAPLMSGTISEGQIGASGTAIGPLPIVGGLIMVQSAAAITSSGAATPILNQVLSTLSSAIANASFVYIPQTTGAIATSSFASGASAPAYTSCGAVLVWDAGNTRLGVYSTAGGTGTWFWSVSASSQATKSFTSS